MPEREAEAEEGKPQKRKKGKNQTETSVIHSYHPGKETPEGLMQKREPMRQNAWALIRKIFPLASSCLSHFLAGRPPPQWEGWRPWRKFLFELV